MLFTMPLHKPQQSKLGAMNFTKVYGIPIYLTPDQLTPPTMSNAVFLCTVLVSWWVLKKNGIRSVFGAPKVENYNPCVGGG